LVEKPIHTARLGAKIETKIIATKGDTAKMIDLSAGRKGLFTAKIEHALLASDVDVAVHSAKDLPSETDTHVEIRAVPCTCTHG
jgi:hydroxymethylbilane synthase